MTEVVLGKPEGGDSLEQLAATGARDSKGWARLFPWVFCLLLVAWAFLAIPRNTPSAVDWGIPDFWPQIACALALTALGAALIFRAHAWKHRYYYLGLNLLMTCTAASVLAIGSFAFSVEKQFSMVFTDVGPSYWFLAVVALVGALALLISAWKGVHAAESDGRLSLAGVTLTGSGVVVFLMVPIVARLSSQANHELPNLIHRDSIEFGMLEPRKIENPPPANNVSKNLDATSMDQFVVQLAEARNVLVNGQRRALYRYDERSDGVWRYCDLQEVVAWRADQSEDGRGSPRSINASISATVDSEARIRVATAVFLQSSHSVFYAPASVKAHFYRLNGSLVLSASLERVGSEYTGEVVFSTTIRPSIQAARCVFEASAPESVVSQWPGGKGNIGFLEIVVTE